MWFSISLFLSLRSAIAMVKYKFDHFTEAYSEELNEMHSEDVNLNCTYSYAISHQRRYKYKIIISKHKNDHIRR